MENQKEITSWEQGVLDALKAFMDKNGFPPTIQELAVARGLTAPTVQYHLYHLRDKGVISWTKGRCRTLRIL
jgi:SOS-response transcriptional repressor LexA